MTLHAQQYDALLLVHFGTTHDNTREKTIETINEKARQQFPGMKVCDCISSSFVIKRLAARGIKKDTPTDALLKLRAEGCRRVLVQPTYIINGVKMDLLRQEIEPLKPLFDEIAIGSPLMTTVDDCQRVCDILVSRHPADAKKREHLLFVGHGTEGPATAIYSQMDYMLRAGGHENYHVASIEGYPTLETAIALLKAQKCRQVTLVPLLFVAGDHATNDIAVEWKAALEQAGLIVRVVMEGLGEVPEIQQLFIGSK
jgi:sirohydrochlorin cobaltochelatase